ncbi:MAG: P-II family nitrogen regulator, partial [Ignavibacteriae bacterium]|nr:P-II family nitrogen regulator [Ignavibacteriota bacterium]
KIKIELVVTNEMADNVVNVIQKAAHTGNLGDVKIYVIDVKKVVRIRTNEIGENAI